MKTKDLGVVRNVAFSKILIKVRKFVIQDPLGETYNYQVDQYEDQSKHILNSILKEELSDSDSEALIVELCADKVFLSK